MFIRGQADKIDLFRFLRHTEMDKDISAWLFEKMAKKEKSSIPLSVRLCSDKAAFEVRMQQKMFLNMDKVRQLFESCHGLQIVVCTPHVIILRSGRAEATLSKDGRMLIKRVSKESEATQVARKILRTALAATIKP